jgi:hypothetical protein
MGVSAEFLPEFDLEMAAARRTLERIPEDKLAWKPHEKSMTLGRLAGHIAELPGMGVSVMKEDALDFAIRPAGEPARKPNVALGLIADGSHYIGVWQRRYQQQRGRGGTQAGSYNLTIIGNSTSGSTTLTRAVKFTLVAQVVAARLLRPA